MAVAGAAAELADHHGTAMPPEVNARIAACAGRLGDWYNKGLHTADMVDVESVLDELGGNSRLIDESQSV